MPNKRHNPMPSKGGHPTGQGGGKIPPIVEKTAAWQGLPGKTQPRTRCSAGTKKVKQSMKSEGV